MEKEPSLADWQRLYEAALRFKEAAPWQWMGDLQVFGVRDPEGDAVDYCSILGNLGDVFGLVAYLGSEGLVSLSRVARAKQRDAFEAYARQNCLSVFFGSRSELTERDRAVIKALGLKFRGSTAWPLFRRQLPGYYPWYLTAEEARFFAALIEQATSFCLELKDNPGLLEPPQPDLVLVRVYDRERGWQSTWFSPPPHVLPVAVPGKAALKRIAAQFPRSNACWETGFFFLPATVREEETGRPFFPLVMLWVDRDSGMILHMEMARYGQWQALAESFTAAAAAARRLPAEIATTQEEVAVLFQDLACGLGINVKKERSAKSFAAARKYLFQGMGPRL